MDNVNIHLQTAGEKPTQKSLVFQGIPIAIEYPLGSIRSGKGKDGKPWQREMKSDYGYIKDANGQDGEGLDVYVGPNPESPFAYVIEQLKDDGSVDEHKVCLGFNSLEEARENYLEHYPPDWWEKNVSGITEFPMSELKESVEEHAV